RYAEYLGLSPVVVLDCYERLGAGQPPPLKRVSQWGNVRATAPQPHDNRWLAYAFIAILFVLVAFWWSTALLGGKSDHSSMTEADAVRSSQQTTIITPLAPTASR
ncbi:MAG: hypothetical protein OEW08_12520, partial [Gammaproteobacteria bacterium]|nr:hypothetical protein [Gammaproteobacteria bacterium]